MRRGLTLVELIISLSLLLLVLMFVLNTFPSSLIGLRHSESRMCAERLAHGSLEEGLAQNFESLLIDTTQPLTPHTLNGIDYTQSLEVFRVPNWDPLRLKGLRVTVKWMDRGRAQQLIKEMWRSHEG